MKAAVIGLGVGEQHIAGYEEAGVEVAAICDIDATKLAEVAGRHPSPRAVADPAMVFGDDSVDVVSIASYDDAHHEQVCAALRAGKHVFVEKPLCQTSDQATEIRALLAERPELKITTNLPLRHSERFADLRERVAAGELGRIYYAEGSYDYGRLWKLTEGWRGKLGFYSVFTGGAIHIVDLLLWITGDRVERVSAAGNRIATEGTQFQHPDLVVALLEFESGLVAKVAANFGCVHPHYHGLGVYGTEGTFINDLGDASLWTRGEDGPVREAIDTGYPAYRKSDLIPGFVEAIRSGGDPPLGVAEVFGSLAVCLAVDEALATGSPAAVRDFG